jgi:multiple sugar transport system substrate-binding protein
MARQKSSTTGMTRRDFLARTSATAAGLIGAAVLDPAGSLFAPVEAASRVTLRFGMYSSPTWVPSYEQIFKNFTKAHPTIALKPEWSPYAAWTQKIATEMASGTEPDVSILDWDDFYDRTSKGSVMPLDNFLKTDPVPLDNFYAPALDWYRYNGKLYALPFNAATTLFYYNKTLFDKAGLRYPDAGWTWNDVVGAARKLTKTSKNGRTTQWGLLVPEFLDLMNGPIWSAGGTGLVNDAYTKPGVNEPIGVKQLQFFYDLIYKEKVAPNPAAMLGLALPFTSGKIAMHPVGPSWEVYSYRSVTNFTWDVTYMPLDSTTKKRITPLFPNAFSIGANTTHPKEAYVLVKFLTDPVRSNSSIALEAGYGSLNPIKWLPETHLFLGGARDLPAHWKYFFTNLQYAKVIPHKQGFREWRTKAGNTYTLMLSGHISPRQAADQMATIISGIISGSASAP